MVMLRLVSLMVFIFANRRGFGMAALRFASRLLSELTAHKEIICSRSCFWHEGIPQPVKWAAPKPQTGARIPGTCTRKWACLSFIYTLPGGDCTPEESQQQ